MLVRRICDIFAVQDRKSVNLLHDIADVDRCCWSPTLHNGSAMGTKIVRCDLIQEAPAPDRKQLAFEDRSPHCPRAVGHRCRDEPLFSELAKTSRLKETPLLALLLDCR